VELATQSAFGAKAFYQELFNWRFEDEELTSGQVYTTVFCSVDANNSAWQPIASLYEIEKSHAAPPSKAAVARPESHWLACISVEDVGVATVTAETLGATIELPVFDMGYRGQMTILRDPAGARLGLLQGGFVQSSGVPPATSATLGMFCWRELATAHAREACKFYTRLFNWTENWQKAGEGDFITLSLYDQKAAGIIAMNKQWSRHPAHWLNFVRVHDSAEIFLKAQNLGATALSELIEIPDFCRYGVLRDPQGAVFAVMDK
jgi:predicted enzyme related to lactoylglutathione lyase